MVYKMTPKGQLTSLYQFDFTHGGGPIGLVQGTDGDFYGTTEVGGTGKLGVVFKITSRGKLTVLYNFDGPHGSEPIGPIIQASDGKFYGTTYRGGTNNIGVVYKMTPTGALTVLHNFNVGDAFPSAGLVQATDGKFYGAASRGTATGHGQLFQITSKGKYTVLRNFPQHGGAAGSVPFVSLFQHTNGTFYSDTYDGGAPACHGGCGVLYSLGMKLGPFVSFVGPLSSGKVGKTIEILGQGFTGTTNVSFNGVSATFAVVSDTYLTAMVPANATTGSVTVTTPGGPLTSNKVFRVTPRDPELQPDQRAGGNSGDDYRNQLHRRDQGHVRRSESHHVLG